MYMCLFFFLTILASQMGNLSHLDLSFRKMNIFVFFQSFFLSALPFDKVLRDLRCNEMIRADVT